MKKLDLESTTVTFTEWFSGIAILNLYWLLFSLPIITLIPATDAVFEVIHNWKKNGKPKNMFNLFNFSFKKNFKKSFKLGAPIFIALSIIMVDLYFLNSLTISAVWFQIFKYAFYTLTLLIFLTFLYVYPLAKEENIFSFQIYLMAFILMMGNPKITLALLITLVGSIFFFNWFPAMLLFIPISGLAWLSETAVENTI